MLFRSATEPHGLFYAPDPSSQGACTIGGNVAENSGGPHTLKYGVTVNHILGLEIVLPDGTTCVYFVNGDPIRASGSVYSSNNKLDAEKYVFYSLAALELPRQINWMPHVIHCNDWHTALTAYGNLVKRWEDKKNRIASLITIHNLPFLGPDVKDILESYGLPLANTDLPDWARVMPMPCPRAMARNLWCFWDAPWRRPLVVRGPTADVPRLRRWADGRGPWRRFSHR